MKITRTINGNGKVVMYWEPKPGFLYPTEHFTALQAIEKYHRDWECPVEDPPPVAVDACGRVPDPSFGRLRSLIRQEFSHLLPEGNNARDI